MSVDSGSGAPKRPDCRQSGGELGVRVRRVTLGVSVVRFRLDRRSTHAPAGGKVRFPGVYGRRYLAAAGRASIGHRQRSPTGRSRPPYGPRCGPRSARCAESGPGRGRRHRVRRRRPRRCGAAWSTRGSSGTGRCRGILGDFQDPGGRRAVAAPRGLNSREESRAGPYRRGKDPLKPPMPPKASAGDSSRASDHWALAAWQSHESDAHLGFRFRLRLFGRVAVIHTPCGTVAARIGGCRVGLGVRGATCVARVWPGSSGVIRWSIWG